MKLYVWIDPYFAEYGSSLIFAVAESVDEAKIEASAGQAYTRGEFNAETPKVDLGEPTRIVDLPCAEWHKWSE